MTPALERPLWLRLGRGLLFMAAMCTAIALFLAVLDGGAGTKFVYSFSIGLSCWLIIDVLRLLVSHGLQVRQRRTGLPPPGPRSFELGWAGMGALVVAGALLGPPLGITIADALTDRRSPPFWNLASRSTQITLAITLLATLVALLVRSAQERASALALRAEAAQRDAAEAQLRLLQSQLEPHMLFNTLANLRVLIGLEPARAQQMLDHLIAFLRSTLAASRARLHPLADEFARVGDYLALMQVRMGPRLQVQLDLPAELAGTPVPPLLLQPLVENAIKHGLEPHVAGGRLHVAAARDGDDLLLTVRDNGAGLPTTPTVDGTGFGLAQVRQRLAALYGPGARLDLAPAPDGAGTAACIRLPVSAPPPEAPA